MATTPVPPHAPLSPAAKEAAAKAAAAATAAEKAKAGAHEAPHVEDREKTPFDDPEQKTIQEEQLERSAEMEKVGVSKWVEEHDERKGADRPTPQHGGQVPGVSPTQKDDPGGKR